MFKHAHSHVSRRRLLTGVVAATLAAGAAAGGASSATAASFDLVALVKGASSGSTLTLNTGTYTLRDFGQANHGVTLGKVGLKGAGVDKTIITMAAYSSTKAGVVPKADYSTNPLYLAFTSGGTPGLSGFTLKGTAQGHLYNGLFVGAATNARVSNVKISGVAGNKNYPPGETFALNDWSTSGSVYSNIRIDGGGTSAVDFGSNSSSNITVNSSTFTGTAYSSGMAMWQTTGITLNDITLKDNRSGINFERSGGTITINRPVLSNNRIYDFQFGTDRTGGTVKINNPVLAAGQKIRINCPLQYHGGTNGQKRSNIHVYVNGVDKTSTLVTYL